MRKAKRLLNILGIVLGGWLLLSLLKVPAQDGPRGCRCIHSLYQSSNSLLGRTLSRQELDERLSRLHLNFEGLNRYTANVDYQSSTNWQVTLIPEKKRAYTETHPLWFRILFLEFDKTTYPEIIISCPTRRE